MNNLSVYKPSFEVLDNFQQNLPCGVFDVWGFVANVFDKEYEQLGGNSSEFFTVVLPKNVYDAFITHACVYPYARAWKSGTVRYPQANGALFCAGHWFVTEEFEQTFLQGEQNDTI